MQFDYGHPQIIQAVTIAALDGIISVFDHDSKNVPPCIESSDDGTEFHKVADIPFSSLVQRTVSFNADHGALLPHCVFQVALSSSGSRRLVFASGARVNQFEKRAGYANSRDFFAITDPNIAPESMVAQQDVVDLTAQNAGGRYAGLDAAGRQVDDSAHRLFAYRA